MKRSMWILMAALALLGAACQPLATPVPPTTVPEPQPLSAIWPPFGEVVDAAPVLQWESFPGATHYQVWVLESGSAAVRLDTDTTETQLPISSPLPGGVSYNWTVQAQDEAHTVLAELNSAFSVKAALGLVYPPDGTVVQAAPLVEWEPFAGAAEYQVLIVDASAYPPAVMVDARTAQTEFSVDAALAPETDYSLTVRALDAQGVVLAESNTRFTVAGQALAYDCGSVSEIPAGECLALARLYAATSGEGWTDQVGWLADDTPCDWAGVTCSDGHVTDLNLFHRNLAGPLPGELGALSHLRVLALHNNALTGPIPPALGQLSALTYLDLSNNDLSGGMPAELGQLAGLQFLFLQGNRLSGPIPASLGGLSALGHLDLSNNALTGEIPPALGQMAALNSLRLGRNDLTGQLPAALGLLPQLYQLDVSENALTGVVPETILALPSRALWGNQFEGTIQCEGAPPMAIDYSGVQFICFSSIGASVWPEWMPGIGPNDNAPFWELRPAHLRFTLAGSPIDTPRALIGAGATTEAQILLYPAAEFAALAEAAQGRIEALRELLATRPAAVPGDLPMLPLVNSQQLLHAQVRYLDFANGSGVRYLTQHAQAPTLVNSQEVFYTFQGLTRDGAWYVSAFIPVTVPALPASAQLSSEEYEALMAGYEAYLAETATLLEAQAAEAFTPDLATLDRLITSLAVNAVQATPTPHVFPPVPEAARAETAAREALAQHLGVDLAAVTLVTLEPATWPDSCLGLAGVAGSCQTGSVAGYRVVLEAAGTRYEVRTDAAAERVHVAGLATP